MSEKPIYLDYNATTPLDPRVLEAMLPWFNSPSNSGSRTHVYGQWAKEAVETARAQVASVIDKPQEDVIFTSGATESNNIAILGLADYGNETGRRHIISTDIEHKAVLEPLERMVSLGFEVELIKPHPGGYVELEAIAEELRDDTLLVSVMHANNETGVLQPIGEISELLKGSDTLFHTDAAQSFGKEVEELRAVEADLISFTAHKIYGPQGVGGIYVRRLASGKRPIRAISVGGHQERDLRHGTVPVALVVGFGQASYIAANEHRTRREHATKLRQKILDGFNAIPLHVNGDQTRMQPHVLNVSFPGVDSEALMMALRDDIAISNGSACTSASYDPSHVLLAMGLDEDRISESVRISWGPGVNTIPCDAIVTAVESMRCSF